MKVLFLDIDGPMIPVRACILPNQTTPARVFDPVAAAMLNAIIRATCCQLVMSTTHRLLGYEHCANLLSSNGIDPAHMHDDWRTQSLRDKTRSDEINQWLDDHPTIKIYAALDDEKLTLHNAIRCTTQDGMTFQNYRDLLTLLGHDADALAFG